LFDRPVGVTGAGAAVPLDVHVDLDFPNGDDLALSRGTDFYGLDELLTDRRVAPAAAGSWERAEFPVELAEEYGRLASPAPRSSATAARD
jgi:hypothetical protein